MFFYKIFMWWCCIIIYDSCLRCALEPILYFVRNYIYKVIRAIIAGQFHLEFYYFKDWLGVSKSSPSLKNHLSLSPNIYAISISKFKKHNKRFWNLRFEHKWDHMSIQSFAIGQYHGLLTKMLRTVYGVQIEYMGIFRRGLFGTNQKDNIKQNI